MTLDEREVAKDEPERNSVGLERLDASVGDASVGTLVVTVDEKRGPTGTTHVVARLHDFGNENRAH